MVRLFSLTCEKLLKKNTEQPALENGWKMSVAGIKFGPSFSTVDLFGSAFPGACITLSTALTSVILDNGGYYAMPTARLSAYLCVCVSGENSSKNHGRSSIFSGTTG